MGRIVIFVQKKVPHIPTTNTPIVKSRAIRFTLSIVAFRWTRERVTTAVPIISPGCSGPCSVRSMSPGVLFSPVSPNSRPISSRTCLIPLERMGQDTQ